MADAMRLTVVEAVALRALLDQDMQVRQREIQLQAEIDALLDAIALRFGLEKNALRETHTINVDTLTVMPRPGE